MYENVITTRENDRAATGERLTTIIQKEVGGILTARRQRTAIVAETNGSRIRPTRPNIPLCDCYTDFKKKRKKKTNRRGKFLN